MVSVLWDSLYGIIYTYETHSKTKEDRMGYIIKNVFEHIEVYDSRGEFVFSADTLREAQEELEHLNAA